MKNLTKEQWRAIISQFCNDCFKFWKREGLSVAEAFDKARQETLRLTHNPFSPKGCEIDKEALRKWSETYNEDMVNSLYQLEKDGTVPGIRLCGDCEHND